MNITKVKRLILEQIADSPGGIPVEELYPGLAKFLPDQGGHEVLGLALFQLELDNRIAEEKRWGVRFWRMTANGFLKEARREHDRRA